jgi:hypothetical protein
MILFVGLASLGPAAESDPLKSAKKRGGVPGVQLPPEFIEFLHRAV